MRGYTKGSKYRAIKDHRIVDGAVAAFDSRKEARRWDYLSALQEKGVIFNLERQKVYELIPKQKDSSGKTIQAVTYRSDFEYDGYLEDGSVLHVVEDVKGVKTEVYKLKKKLMLYFYRIEIDEV